MAALHTYLQTGAVFFRGVLPPSVVVLVSPGLCVRTQMKPMHGRAIVLVAQLAQFVRNSLRVPLREGCLSDRTASDYSSQGCGVFLGPLITVFGVRQLQQGVEEGCGC